MYSAVSMYSAVNMYKNKNSSPITRKAILIHLLRIICFLRLSNLISNKM